MKLIGITQETIFDGESDAITLLLENGLDQMHIRKPGYLSDDIATLLQKIPTTLHTHLFLHDHFELTTAYNIGGIHLNRRNPLPPIGYKGLTGRSCHSFDEVKNNTSDYCFLSPIYNSISKQGYISHFSPEELEVAHRKGIIHEQVYALGGITPERLPELKRWGFGGAALLGYLWEEKQPTQMLLRMQNLCAKTH